MHVCHCRAASWSHANAGNVHPTIDDMGFRGPRGSRVNAGLERKDNVSLVPSAMYNTSFSSLDPHFCSEA